MVTRVEADELPGLAERLGEILADAVGSGASVGFLAGLTATEAAAWWRQSVAPRLAAGSVVLFVARAEGEVAGTVQLVLPDYPNGRGRAEIAKLLVHSSWRRRGIGERLLIAAEAEARADGRHTLVLDTAGADAQRLYERLGWSVAGRIPAYALDPHGRPEATTFMFRRLGERTG